MHLAFFTTPVGRAKATAAVHRVLTELYTPDTFPGDEDNGEMSAWYLLAAMGIYPLRPGVAEYVTVTPFFERLVVTLENGGRLEIRPGGDARCVTHAQLLQGGQARFGASVPSTGYPARSQPPMPPATELR